ncbi:MAG: hypothetical protein KGO05_02200, partial [Chloroflexota bacterium]|nr:hypothetical protein [Chloroflexota bacterium]
AFVVGNFWALSWGLAAYHVATFAYAMWVFLSGRLRPLAPPETLADAQRGRWAGVRLAAKARAAAR